MGWSDHSAAFILCRHSGRQIWMVRSLHYELHFVSGSTPAHDSPHNNLCSDRTPLFFYPVYLWCNILCGPASVRHLFKKNLFFCDAFSLRGRNREWSGRKWPPSERGIPRGCISPRLTLIHSHNIWMCDDDLYQQICVRPNGVLAQCRKREKSSHRKSLFTSLCAILLTICKDLYLSILTW